MPKKGQINNPNGRPKGSKNKVTGPLRTSITTFLEGEFDTIKKDFKKLPPANRLKFYTDLLPYGVPRLSSVDMGISLEKLTEDQVDELFDRVIKSVNEK